MFFDGNETFNQDFISKAPGKSADGKEARLSLDSKQRGESTRKELDELKAKVKPEDQQKPEKSQLSPEQQEIVDRLNNAKSCKERVELFATIADEMGLDVLLGLIPVLGDAGSSMVSGLYLLFEAKNLGLGRVAYLKIIALQGADFAIGSIPIVGDIADHFFKANKWSIKYFNEQVEKLVLEAKKSGVPEEEIAKITKASQNFEAANKVVKGGALVHKAAKLIS